MDILSYAGLRRSSNVATQYQQTVTRNQVPISNICISNLVGALCLQMQCTGYPSGACSTWVGCCWCSLYINPGLSNLMPGNDFNENATLSVICAMECLDSESLVRSGAPVKGGFKVCDTSSCFFRCGACCLWTVPAGASRAQFQIWGAGGGNSGQCCCGGAPFGPSGAYATVTIPVTPGNQYTLCAGCAFCCYANQTTAGNGNSSYVTGSGLCNFCAMGGSSVQGAWGSGVRWNSNKVTLSHSPACHGISSCSGYNFCWDNGAHIVDRDYEYARCSMFAGCGLVGGVSYPVYGFPGMLPKFVIPLCCLHAGWTQSAPIVGYLQNSRCFFRFSNGSLDGSSVGGCAFSSISSCGGVMLVPGQGGFAYFMCAGGIGCGDAGRMGMVCVTWV